MKRTVRLFLSGFGMGAADLVPGVSGGTIAFLLGIYEELLHAIKTVTGKTLRLLIVERNMGAALKTVPFSFLVPLGLGIFTAIISLANLLSYLLVEYPSLIWSFFFGLVAASIWIVRKRVVTWNMHDYVVLGVSGLFAYILVGLVPVETSTHPLMFVLSGAIAICAMILPGISGSFLLLIMGKYEQVLTAVTERDVVTLMLFMIGIVIGISLFSRFLSWLFAKHHDVAIAALCGFMIGSMRKVWPWKEVLTTRMNSHGEMVPLVERNIIPALNEGSFLTAILLMIGGAAIILLITRMQETAEKTKDVADPAFSRQHRQTLKSQQNGKI